MAFLAGVFVRSFVLVPDIFFFAAAPTAVFFAAFGLFGRRKALLIGALLVSMFMLGVLRFDLKEAGEKMHAFDDVLGEVIVLSGTIKEDPDVRENSQRLIVESSGVRVLVSAERYPEFSYGDLVNVSGILERPESFTTDTGKEFRYDRYLQNQSIYYLVPFADVEFVESGHGSKLKAALLSAKQAFLESIERQIERPKSSLLAGLLLGVKQALGDKLETDFVRTGLVHIVVLSGYNVTIVAEAIMRAVGFLPLAVSASLGGLAIIAFALMAGAGATVVRASVMALLALLARATGNTYDISRALILAAFLMVLHNPFILAFDISFQLSFVATIGLINLTPIVQPYFSFLPLRFGLQDIAAASIAVQIFVLPFILYMMGTLSIIAPVTNLLVLPFIPLTMLFGFLSGILGLVAGPLAMPFSFVADLFLSLEIAVVRFFSGLPFAATEVRAFPLIVMLTMYAAFFWIIKEHRRMKSVTTH